jgi:hypothetical protein
MTDTKRRSAAIALFLAHIEKHEKGDEAVTLAATIAMVAGSGPAGTRKLHDIICTALSVHDELETAHEKAREAMS